MTDRDPAADARQPSVAVLLLVQMRRGAACWGWSRVALGARLLRQVEGLRFARALGCGREGGFGLQPSLYRQGLFTLFDNDWDADAFIDASPVTAAYRAHARECLVAKLRATASRGSWAGMGMAVSAASDPTAPVAALTRGSIRARRALAFWRHSPASEAGLAAAAGCQLAVGLGEAPVLRQATFSLWDDSTAMEAYARSGAHRDAARAAQAEGHFRESMFVRFAPQRLEGQWQGQRYG